MAFFHSWDYLGMHIVENCSMPLLIQLNKMYLYSAKTIQLSQGACVHLMFTLISPGLIVLHPCINRSINEKHTPFILPLSWLCLILPESM